MFDKLKEKAESYISGDRAKEIEGKFKDIVSSEETNVDYDTIQANNLKERRLLEKRSPRGITANSIANAFMGFNHRMALSVLPKNREQQGFTFFTRPDMNFEQGNLDVSRRFQEMSLSPEGSLDYAILAALDPLFPLAQEHPGLEKLGAPFKPSVKFDNRQAFIPILSNTLLSMSGFPDHQLDLYTSEEGLRREQWSMVDSVYETNFTFSLSTSFRNIDGDPVTKMATVWLEYMAGVYGGEFLARVSNRIQRRKDYETAIYRFLTDPTGRFVTKYCRTIGFPVNDNIGAIMNYDITTPFVSDNDTINLQFHCQGAEYNDPILIEEFNYVVAMHNPNLIKDPTSSDYVPLGKDNIVRVTRADIEYFNWYGYPYIDPITKEIFWYVGIDEYTQVMEEVNGNV